MFFLLALFCIVLYGWFQFRRRLFFFVRSLNPELFGSVWSSRGQMETILATKKTRVANRKKNCEIEFLTIQRLDGPIWKGRHGDKKKYGYRHRTKATMRRTWAGHCSFGVRSLFSLFFASMLSHIKFLFVQVERWFVEPRNTLGTNTKPYRQRLSDRSFIVSVGQLSK